MWLIIFLLGFLGGYFFPSDMKADVKAYFEKINEVPRPSMVVEFENKNLVDPKKQMYNGSQLYSTMMNMSGTMNNNATR